VAFPAKAADSARRVGRSEPHSSLHDSTKGFSPTSRTRNRVFSLPKMLLRVLPRLQKRPRIPRNRLNEIIRRRRGVTADTALPPRSPLQDFARVLNGFAVGLGSLARCGRRNGEPVSQDWRPQEVSNSCPRSWSGWRREESAHGIEELQRARLRLSYDDGGSREKAPPRTIVGTLRKCRARGLRRESFQQPPHRVVDLAVVPPWVIREGLDDDAAPDELVLGGVHHV